MDYQRVVEPPNRGFVIGATIGGGALGACAMIAVALILRMPSEPPPPPAPTPIANVTVVPAAPVIVQVPVPAPVVEAPPPAVPAVRASTPVLQAHCLYGEDAPEIDRATCDWDDGFPAISPDGKTIAIKHSDDDSGRGNPNLQIELFDVATGKRVRSVNVLGVDEYDRKHDELQALVRPRVTKVNALVADYRSLAKVDSVDDEELAGSRLRLEQQDAIARVVDTQTQTAIYQRDFSASTVYPKHVSNPETDCSGLAQLGTISAWWDEPTRTIVSSVYYAYGGCMCGGQTDTFVKRLR